MLLYIFTTFVLWEGVEGMVLHEFVGVCNIKSGTYTEPVDLDLRGLVKICANYHES